jgi:hypothetical protein
MSHHLDSPIARQDVRLDITDLYLFRGEVGTVFVINVCHSIAGAVPSPGFHPEGMYEFKVDLNGDAVEEITYRIKFDERDANGAQRLSAPSDRRRTGDRSPCAGCAAAEGRDRREILQFSRPSYLGRKGGRSVLDRTRRAACGRPRAAGRHDRRF